MFIGIGIGIPFSRVLGGFTPVSVPLGFLTTPPFGIQKNGTNYRIQPDFDLEAYANIAVTNTYYVDSVNGNNANTGLSWAQAWKTLARVQSAGNADLVYIAANSYFQKNERSTQYTRNIKFIGLGSGASRPRITADVNNQTGPFSLHSGSCYVANISEFVGYAFDRTNLNSFGNPRGLTAAASIAACIATPNSFFTDWPNTDVYVNLFNGRVPDANLILGDSLAMQVNADNRRQYFENIEFGGVQMLNSTSAGGLRMYFKNCKFATYTAFGVSELIAQDCEGVRNISAGDVANYDSRLTIATTAYEINCDYSNQRLGNSTNQASTTHNGCTIVRVGGKYHNNGGQCIADVTTNVGQTWMLGCELYESVSGVGAYFDLKNVWLDGVFIRNVNIGLQIQGTCQGFYRNLRNQANIPTQVAGTASFIEY